MIQTLKRHFLMVIFTLTIVSVIFIAPDGGLAQGSEPTPLPEPTTAPDTIQTESIEQEQSSIKNISQFNRGFDPATLKATFYDYPDLYHKVITKPWNQTLDFYLDCYGQNFPFKGCQLIPDLSDGANWSVHWEGTLIVPQNGDYTFSLPQHDDGVRVILDNNLIIDSGWNYPYSDSLPSPQTVTLSAGQYNIIVDYEQRMEYIAALQLRWIGPDFPSEVIPIYSPPQVPPHSRSLYWQGVFPVSGDLDTSRLYQFGCSEAEKKNGSIVVVLDFGDPLYYGGTYYTRLPSSITWIKLENIEAGVKSYIRGYWDCSDGAPLGSEHLVLAVGTNNAGIALDTNNKLREHGEAWGYMINNLRYWLLHVPILNYNSTQYVNYSSRVSVVGATNIEQWGGKALPQGAIEWVEGYASKTIWPYYNFGACEDCGFSSPDPKIWDQDHYWYLSWGVPNAWPLPLIYNQTLAQKWQELSKYGATCQDCLPENSPFYGRMYFAGSYTQKQACDDTSSSCSGTDISPEEGWQALYTALFSDPDTSMEILSWSTDVAWDVYLDP